MMEAKLIRRVMKDLWTVGKKGYGLTLIKALFEKSLPFINILYMGLILQQLAAGHFDQVVRSIVHYLLIFVVFQLGSSIVTPYVEEHHQLLRRKLERLPYEKMLRMSFHYADQAGTHEKLHHISRDMVQNNSSLINISLHIREAIGHFVALVWSIILLVPLWRPTAPTIVTSYVWVNAWWVNISLILLMLVSITAQAGLMQQIYKMLGDTGEEIREQNAFYYYMFTKLADPESGKEIRLYALQDKIRKVSQKHLETTLDWFKKYYRKNAKAKNFGNAISQLLTFILYGLIGVRVLIGSLPIGQLIQLSGALSQLIVTLPNLLSFISIFAQPAPLQRYYELMDYPEEIVKGSIPVEKRLDNHYTLSVENLSFSYPGAADMILKDINEHFEIGKKYAIVGENGSGKTTFIKVLMRLYEPDEGEVKLNQIDAGKYNLSEYYRLFGVVFQDYRLLGFKLGQNIAVHQEYDEKLSGDILIEVGLSDFIATLSEGLETNLGKEYEESGVNLSGGQAQKVAMARALYKDAPIMILDEPTAALDPVAEFEIYQKFSEMAADKTAFYISHRLSSCRFCDEVLVFDQGGIVQRGSHDKLVKESGKYQELWHAQAQYYK